LLEWGTWNAECGMRNAESPDSSAFQVPHSAFRGRWWLVLSAAAFGLSLGIHLSNVLYLPAFGVFMLLGWPVRRQKAEGRRQDAELGNDYRLPATDYQLLPVPRFDIPGGVLSAAVFLLVVAVPYTWVYFDLPQVPVGDAFPKAAPGWPLFYEATFN